LVNLFNNARTALVTLAQSLVSTIAGVSSDTSITTFAAVEATVASLKNFIIGFSTSLDLSVGANVGPYCQLMSKFLSVNLYVDSTRYQACGPDNFRVAVSGKRNELTTYNFNVNVTDSGVGNLVFSALFATFMAALSFF